MHGVTDVRSDPGQNVFSIGISGPLADQNDHFILLFRLVRLVSLTRLLGQKGVGQNFIDCRACQFILFGMEPHSLWDHPIMAFWITMSV